MCVYDVCMYVGVCGCVCVYGLFEEHKSLSIGYCYWTIPPPPPTRGEGVSVLQETFLTGQKQLKHFGSFPLAGIMVPGVIVHLLCISVIFAKL